MSEKRSKNQAQLALPFVCGSEAPVVDREGTEAPRVRRETENPAGSQRVMEEVCERENRRAALKRVRANQMRFQLLRQGSPGIDGKTVDELPEYLEQHWPAIGEQLLSGTYEPKPVLRVEIDKPDGGVRKLGIPTVLDRFVQQAVQQVLQKQWDPTFSEHSYGFRPGRSAKQAVAQAQQYIAEGYGWCVDFDLEKFLDTASYCPLIHENSSNSGGC
jgi:RNA-directed DNA polymerase